MPELAVPPVRQGVRIAAAREALAARPLLFTEEPHPHAYWQAHGKTQRDYLDWALGGRCSQYAAAAACAVVEQAVAGESEPSMRPQPVAVQTD